MGKHAHGNGGGAPCCISPGLPGGRRSSDDGLRLSAAEAGAPARALQVFPCSAMRHDGLTQSGRWICTYVASRVSNDGLWLSAAWRRACACSAGPSLIRKGSGRWTCAGLASSVSDGGLLLTCCRGGAPAHAVHIRPSLPCHSDQGHWGPQKTVFLVREQVGSKCNCQKPLGWKTSGHVQNGAQPAHHQFIVS